jgi:hypothetical protein
MVALMESQDPDDVVHAAWLAQVSKAAERLPADRTSQKDTGPLPRGLLEPADPRVNQGGRRSPNVKRSAIAACILLVVVAVPLLFFQRGPQPALEQGSSGPPPARQNGVGAPKLIVEPSSGTPGEPVPLGLSLQGQVDDAMVIITGLVPGMQLSAGSPIAGNEWQVRASDVTDAWVGPPAGFVGSATLVAELRLPDGQIADHQALRVEWTRPAFVQGQPREEIKGHRTAPTPSVPATVPPPPSTQTEPSQDQMDKQHGQNIRTRGRANSRRTTHDGLKAAPDSNHTVRGFWDWSR